MRQVILAMFALSFCAMSFASVQPINPSTQTQKLQALSQAWKSYHSLQGNRPKDDIEMVYGGADITPSATRADVIHA